MSGKSSIHISAETDDGYDQFESEVQAGIGRLVGPLFSTDATVEALWDAYLNGFPAERRQHYNCHCCRRFVQRFGGLVTMDAGGATSPAVWQADPPAFFAPSVSALRRLVSRARVDGVFLSSEEVWGTSLTGEWSHLSAPSPQVYAGRALTAAQAMAEKAEDFKILSHGLADYPAHVVTQALRVLKADALDRSEKTVGVAEFLVALQTAIAANKARKDNLVWRAVAEAPPGFCHVRSTMISTLLDDLVAGLPFTDVAKRWADKMHPLRYQRPTAAPSEGTIAQAERGGATTMMASP